MRNNKYKTKVEKEEVDDLKEKGYVYLVKNPASNEMTLCASSTTLKTSQAVIYETRYGLDLGFVVGDASKLGQPYQGGDANPCGCKSFEVENIKSDDSDLLASSEPSSCGGCGGCGGCNESSQEVVSLTEDKIENLSKIVEEVKVEIDQTVEDTKEEMVEDLKTETLEKETDEEVILFRDYGNLSHGDEGEDDNKVKVSDDAVWIERIATTDDLKKYNDLTSRENDALTLCREKIKKHKLDMKLVTAHFLLVEPKIVFFFTADVRVDFRELVKDLVGIFRIRIELRQIGVRDESRLLGGLAVCGRDYCCHCITDKLSPVSIKMAKEQNLSLNSIKISGPCGRLLCCLAYEQDFYSEEKLKYPTEGSRLKIGRDLFRVSEVNILSKKITLVGPEGRMRTIDGARVYLNSDSGFWVLEKDYIKELLSE